MSSLKRDVRSQATRGAYVYATVEDAALGLATIRLAGKGPRLTNLTVLGPDVVAGDRVIVDYAAEGPPIVRKITTPTPDLEEEMEPPAVLEPNTGFIY